MAPSPQGQVIGPDAPSKGGAPGQVTEGFGAIQRTAQVETAAQVLAEQAKATIQARYIVAERNPRDFDAVRQKLLRDCDRPVFANTAVYSKPVGGTTVRGLSVRFAEAALRHMGNVLTDPAIIYDDGTKRIVRVTVTDLEANTTYSKDLLIEKTVERKSLKQGQTPLGSRLNSKGERVYLVEATEDDLTIKEAAQMSKAIRQLGLRIVPGDIQDECLERIYAIQADKAAKDPDGEKKKLLDAFDDMGIRVEQLKEYLGLQDLSTLTPKDLVNLRGVYQALKDGETNWREVMEQREGVRGKDGEQAGKTNRTEDVLNKMGRNAQAPDPAPATPPAAAPVSAPTDIPGVVTGAELFGKSAKEKK